ncbi:H-N-H-endonuclease [Salmonella phage BSP22A]|uniref:H-N-H-endonuclease n=1 Tax=Salmonella phage BSP22A TaxID=1960312 RepID=A0A2P0QDN4_9CAUD|nr:H-N-H-endonuclease [Salmonella phage BSP22A]
MVIKFICIFMVYCLSWVISIIETEDYYMIS